jgi:hypothetical protein
MEKGKLLYKEDLNHFLRRKIFNLIFGIILITGPSLILFLFFFDLLEWSSLFEDVIAQILIFLTIAPLVGLIFILMVFGTERFKIYENGFISPMAMPPGFIEKGKVTSISTHISDEEPKRIMVILKNDMDVRMIIPINVTEIKIGKYHEIERSKIMEAARLAGIETSFAP